MNLRNDQTFLKKGDSWREREVKLEKTAQIKESVIGAGSMIGDGATVVNSVVGRKCLIGPHAIVRDSILWDNVTVGQDVSILHSIVEMDNNVLNGCQLNRAVLLTKTILPSNTTIKGNDCFIVYGSDGNPIDYAEDSDEEEASFQIGTILVMSINKRHSQSDRLGSVRNRQ